MPILAELGEFVSKAAPVLGAAISTISPFGGMAFNLIASAFGVKGDDQEALLNAIKADPNAAIKLQEIQNQHEQALGQIANQAYATEVEDRKNARSLAQQAGSDYQLFLRWFAVLITLGFFVTLGAMFTPLVNITPTEKQFLAMLVGVLVSKWQTIIDFFYGSANHVMEDIRNDSKVK